MLDFSESQRIEIGLGSQVGLSSVEKKERGIEIGLQKKWLGVEVVPKVQIWSYTPRGTWALWAFLAVLGDKCRTLGKSPLSLEYGLFWSGMEVELYIRKFECFDILEFWKILEIRMSEGAAETPGWGPTTTILVKTLFLLDFFFFCRAGGAFTLPHSPLCG